MVKPKQKRSSLSRFICRLVTFRWFNRKSKGDGLDDGFGPENDPIRQGQGDLASQVRLPIVEIVEELRENSERKISCKSQDEIFYQPVVKRKEYFEKCFPSVQKPKENQDKAQSLQNVTEIKEEETQPTCEEDSQVSFSAPNLSKDNPLPSTSKIHEIYHAESVTPYESQVFELDTKADGVNTNEQNEETVKSKVEEHNLFIHSSMIIDGIQKISTFSEEDVVSSNWKERSLISIEESMVANCCSGPNSVKTEDLEYENPAPSTNRALEEDYLAYAELSDYEEYEHANTPPCSEVSNRFEFKQENHLAFGDSLQNIVDGNSDQENYDAYEENEYEEFQNSLLPPMDENKDQDEPIFAFDEPEMQNEDFEPQIEIRVYDRLETFEPSGDGLHYEYHDGYLDLPCEQERGDYDDVEEYFVYGMSDYDRPTVVIPPEIFVPNGINFGYDCIASMPISVVENVEILPELQFRESPKYEETSHEVVQDVIQEILDKMVDKLAQNSEFSEFSYIGTTEEEENRCEYEKDFPENENRLEFTGKLEPEFSMISFEKETKNDSSQIPEEEKLKKTRKRRNRRKKKTENCSDENGENVSSQRRNSLSESSSADKLSVRSGSSAKVDNSQSLSGQPTDQPSKKKRKRGKRK